MGRRSGLGLLFRLYLKRFARCLKNSCLNGRQILADLDITKAQYTKASGVKIGISLDVMPCHIGSIVDTSIHFDNKFMLGAVEVEDERLKGMLFAETQILQPSAP